MTPTRDDERPPDDIDANCYWIASLADTSREVQSKAFTEDEVRNGTATAWVTLIDPNVYLLSIQSPKGRPEDDDVAECLFKSVGLGNPK